MNNDSVWTARPRLRAPPDAAAVPGEAWREDANHGLREPVGVEVALEIRMGKASIRLTPVALGAAAQGVAAVAGF